MSEERSTRGTADSRAGDAKDPTYWSAAAMAARVRRRQVSAEDVVRAHLYRIDVRDGELNAFQLVRGEAALAEARALEQRADLEQLPLAGVPVAIKDNVDVAGEPTRHGTNATPSAPATRDDELVARLRRAGAIVVGKTRMPELAIWPFTESAAFGVTRNPWNRERTTGGSSGGSAAAVAARMVPLALASDGGGSIRIPAACCGIPGLKPGPGVIPLAGGVPDHWYGMSEYGPMARGIDDLALMFDVLRGAAPARLDPPSARLRIAMSTRAATFGAPVATEVRQAVESMATVLANAGHHIERADPPYGADNGLRFMRRWFPGIADDADPLKLEDLEPRNQSVVKIGRWLRQRGWQRQAALDPFGARMRRWFERCDVLLAPTLTGPAVPVGKWKDRSWFATLMGCANWLNTAPWNLARFPAATIPGGLTRDGLPIGLQLVALPGGEAQLLALMAQIERLQPWPTAPA